MITLTQLEYIVAVDKFQHFGRAAQACHVAQPSLSAQILKAEKELGVRIFERTQSTFVVTEVGKEIIKQAKVALNEAARIQDIVAIHQGEIKGTLRLGMIPTIAPFLLPHILPEIQKSYPQLRIEIHEQRTSTLLEMIERAEIDAAVLSTPATAPETLREKVLYYEPFVLFASHNHPLSKKRSISPDDLDTHIPYLLDDTHCMRDQVEKICKASQNINSSIQIKSGTLQTLVEIVSSAGGYTLLPILARESFEKSHPRSFMDFTEPKPARKVSLVFHRSYLKRPLIDAVTQAITTHLPKKLIPVSARNQARIITPKTDRFDA